MKHVKKTATVAVAMLMMGSTAAYAAVIDGTKGDDTLIGTQKHDEIRGLPGDDLIKGLDGTDNLTGGYGDDTIYGGPGEDYLRGSSGNDNLYGGPDNTTAKKTDHYRCGSGFDVVHVEKAEHSVHDVSPNCEEVVKEK